MGLSAGPGPVDDSEGEPSADLDSVMDALDQLASVLPAGHELFTAVYDQRSEASDVLLRDGSGATSVRLGLSDGERAHLAALLASLGTGFIGEPPFPARPPFPTRPPAPAAPTAPADPAAPAGLGQRRFPTELRPVQPDPAAVEDTRETDGQLTGREGQLAEHDYRAIVEECPVPLVVIDAGGMIHYASPAVVPSLGVSEPAALEGVPFAQLLHPDDRGRVARVTDLSLRKLDTTTLTVRLRRRDGSLLRAELGVRVLPGRDRLILALAEAGAVRSGIDEVLESERRQRALAAAADAGTALISAAGGSAGALIDFNPQFGHLTGGAPGQLVGRAVWELVQAADAARVRQAMSEVLDGDGARRLEVRLAGDPARRASLAIGLDRSSGDPPRLATVLLRDLTHHGISMDEQTRTVERLTQQNRELAEFARVTAHDLMAPLRALSGLVDVLSPQLEEQSEDALMAVQTAIGRMIAMVDSTMGFADAQAREPDHQPVDFSAVLDRVLATLAPDILATDAEISVGQLPSVAGDDIQLERLFVSLISNALSYSGDGPPQIRITAERDGEMWRIGVADEGIGVDPEAREAIFGLFERRAGALDRTGSFSRSGAGYGIGLATARKIVEHHGGRIWVEPNHPRGSIFALTLPSA